MNDVAGQTMYGPYRHGQRWRVHVKTNGRTTYKAFDTFGKASAYIVAGQQLKSGQKSRKKRGPSWVYFIRCLDGNDHIKIGYARDTAVRLADLQMGCPYGLELLAEFRTTEPSMFEAEIHERFAHLRVRGEWFRSAPELLDLIKIIPSRSEMGRSVRAASSAQVEP